MLRVYLSILDAIKFNFHLSSGRLLWELPLTPNEWFPLKNSYVPGGPTRISYKVAHGKGHFYHGGVLGDGKGVDQEMKGKKKVAV